jgi:hypothetical protein
VIREDWRARRPAAPPRLADLHRGSAIAEWPVVPFTPAAAERAIAWEDAGGSTVAGARIDRYLLHHGALSIPLLHIHRAGAAPAVTIVDVSLHGKVGPAEWSEVVRLLDQGHDVLSFDLRGVGETRMRYRAESIDDPALAALDEVAAYESPLSGVLENHVYNAQVAGRPYFLEMIEDVEIVVRFARARLDRTRVQVRARGDAQTLAEAAAEVVEGVELGPGGEPAFRWSRAVETMQETWPIQYLLPRGADYK